MAPGHSEYIGEYTVLSYIYKHKSTFFYFKNITVRLKIIHEIFTQDSQNTYLSLSKKRAKTSRKRYTDSALHLLQHYILKEYLN